MAVSEMQSDEHDPAPHRLDSDRGDEMRAKVDAARREREKRHRYREESHGQRLDKMRRDDVVELAKRIGREYGVHLAKKLNGRRAWRNLISKNDRLLLLTQIEKDHYEQRNTKH